LRQAKTDLEQVLHDLRQRLSELEATKAAVMTRGSRGDRSKFIADKHAGLQLASDAEEQIAAINWRLKNHGHDRG